MPNIPLLISSVLFIIIGILTIATASTPFAINEGLSPNYYFVHQLICGFLPGIILGIIAFLIPLNFFKKYAFWFFVLSYLFMFTVFIPGIGINEGGASRWINLFGFSFQPSELLKITSILYLGALFSSEKIKKPFINFIVAMILIFFALYMQSDLSTLVTIFTVSIAIFFSANTKLREMAIILSGGLISFLALILLSPYRMERVMTLLNPLEDVSGDGYQINQSLISIGSGGLNGSGLGLSAQKLGFIPESMSDSIFTIYAEELGFLGCAFLIITLAVFAIYAFNVAKKANLFGRLLSIGIITWLVVQTFINIGAMTGIIPVTGIPLPFLSYGGSHLIVELIALGFLLNVSRPVNNN
ncbi:MAG: FtsW/RodA/SpoVE family cell cycle protein [Candidatus Pacebacteria bacterium]|nr:FtsW/RodA/SpoVE family cell cycle protein [Candidatus Paceibacterota bacterium]